MKYDHQKFRNDVSEIDWSLAYSSSDVNVAVSHFNSKLREPMDNHAPFIEKRAKGRKDKRLNAEIKSEMNSRDKLHRRAQKSRKEKELKSLKRQKAPGIEELPPGLLKDCAEIIAGPLAYIIYQSKHLQYPQFGKSQR